MSASDPDETWERLLDRFERDAAGTPAEGPWTAPACPLPPDLVERAREVSRHQQERIAHIRAELDDVRDQLAAIRSVPPASHDIPVYLDTTL